MENGVGGVEKIVPIGISLVVKLSVMRERCRFFNELEGWDRRGPDFQKKNRRVSLK